jgi:hypothetical protein
VAFSPWCLGALGLEKEEKASYPPYCPGTLGLEQEKESYTSCFPGALGFETLSLEKALFSLCSPGALGLEQEKADYAPYCPGALELETLSLGLEREVESLMDERFEQASACLK